MAQATTDHRTIRDWAERNGGTPAAVESTHRSDDVGILRIMFPNAPHSDHQHLTEISWDEFFREFEQRQLALLYDEERLFSKLIGRDILEKREDGESGAARR